MFHPVHVHADAPDLVRVFVRQVVDMFLADVHAMLRLPQPDVGITEGCNYASAAILMHAISGVSVHLYAPPPDGQQTGQKFKDTCREFYPWDAEPAGAFTEPDGSSKFLYVSLRNPLVHAFGYQDPEPHAPLSLTRLEPVGPSEDWLERVETAEQRPTDLLKGAPTLSRNPVTQGIDCNVEAFYWGVRELVRRLTADRNRMAAAETHFRAMRPPAREP